MSSSSSKRPRTEEPERVIEIDDSPVTPVITMFGRHEWVYKQEGDTPMTVLKFGEGLHFAYIGNIVYIRNNNSGQITKVNCGVDSNVSAMSDADVIDQLRTINKKMRNVCDADSSTSYRVKPADEKKSTVTVTSVDSNNVSSSSSSSKSGSGSNNSAISSVTNVSASKINSQYSNGVIINRFDGIPLVTYSQASGMTVGKGANVSMTMSV